MFGPVAIRSIAFEVGDCFLTVGNTFERVRDAGAFESTLDECRVIFVIFDQKDQGRKWHCIKHKHTLNRRSWVSPGVYTP